MKKLLLLFVCGTVAAQQDDENRRLVDNATASTMYHVITTQANNSVNTNVSTDPHLCDSCARNAHCIFAGLAATGFTVGITGSCLLLPGCLPEPTQWAALMGIFGCGAGVFGLGGNLGVACARTRATLQD